MLVFGENDSRLSNFLQTQIFWNFDHISKIYSHINYRNNWFSKVILILIMTTQVLFPNVFFSEKDAPQCRWEILQVSVVWKDFVANKVLPFKRIFNFKKTLCSFCIFLSTKYRFHDFLVKKRMRFYHTLNSLNILLLL